MSKPTSLDVGPRFTLLVDGGQYDIFADWKPIKFDGAAIGFRAVGGMGTRYELTSHELDSKGHTQATKDHFAVVGGGIMAEALLIRGDFAVSAVASGVVQRTVNASNEVLSVVGSLGLRGCGRTGNDLGLFLGGEMLLGEPINSERELDFGIEGMLLTVGILFQ